MFLELTGPVPLDRVSTSDRVKVRIREAGVPDGRYWVNLSFNDEQEAVAFFRDCIELVEAPNPAFDSGHVAWRALQEKKLKAAEEKQ